VKRAAACVSAAIASAILVACTDAPTTTGAGAATSPCSPLAEPGATVTAEGLTMDGHYVVVVSRAGATRVFYGVASHMVEGVITGMPQSCAVEVHFDIDGRSEVATLSPGLPGCAVASMLTSGNTGDAVVQVPLMLVVPPDTGALAFYCL